MWSLDEIEAVNVGMNGSSPRVSRVLSIGAAWPQLLCETSELLEKMDTPHVASFFQLPYAINPEPYGYRVPAFAKGAFFDFRFFLVTISVDDQCRLLATPKGADLPRGHSAVATITQVVALMPYWARRHEYYEKYAACVTLEGLRNSIVMPPDKSIKPDGTAMLAAEFEESVTSGLVLELFAGLRTFLPAYSLASMTEAPVVPWLYGYFTMPAPGRVCFNRTPAPVLGGLVEDPQLSSLCRSQHPVAPD